MKKLILLAGLICLQPILYAAVPPPSDFVYPVKASDRAQHHFRENHPEVQEAQWFSTSDDGMYCYYKTGVLKNLDFYNEHGDWLYTQKSYEPAALAKNVKTLIESRFSDYRICYVNEILSDEPEPVYIINLENRDHIKVVRVFGDNIDVRQTLNKN